MHIDVHRRKRQLEEYRARGVFPRDDGVAVGLLERGLHQAALDIAAVDEKVLHRPVGPPGVRLDDVSIDGHAVPLGARYLDHVRGHLLTEHRKHRGDQFALAVGREYLLAVADQRKSDFGMGQRGVLDHTQYVTSFGEILFEEFHARRCVVKQVTHHNSRALRAACLLICLDFTGLQMQVQPGDRPGLPGEQVDAGHRRDRSKRFAAEAQCADCGKVLLGAQLAGRVAAEGDGRVLRRHAAAVVRNAQISDAAVFDFHGNTGRAGIDRVLDQLFCDRGRALHHLARCDQVGKMRG